MKHLRKHSHMVLFHTPACPSTPNPIVIHLLVVKREPFFLCQPTPLKLLHKEQKNLSHSLQEAFPSFSPLYYQQGHGHSHRYTRVYRRVWGSSMAPSNRLKPSVCVCVCVCCRFPLVQFQRRPAHKQASRTLNPIRAPLGI